MTAPPPSWSWLTAAGITTGPVFRPIAKSGRLRDRSLISRRAHQRDCGSMANKLGQLRVVPKPQREHVAGATEDDGFPPTEVLEIMPSNHGDQLALFSSWFGPPLCGAITLFHQTSVMLACMGIACLV